MSQITVHHFPDNVEILPTARIAQPAAFKRIVREHLPNPNAICLYVIACDKTAVYVGSSKNIGPTLARGHQRGKYPYKWLKTYSGRVLEAHLFSFEGVFECLRDEHVREAIESEVVYEIRRRSGHWPLAQNEIHFWESLRSHTQVAHCVGEVMSRLTAAQIVPIAATRD